MNKEEIKKINLDKIAKYQKELCSSPKLHQLFLELTLKCNEFCFHCGSGCGHDLPDGLPIEKYKEILDEVKEEFGTRPLIAVTGGEPLMYKDFFELVNYIHELGFKWGMTSNATLITEDVAKKLCDAGMFSISVSIDGLPETHDRYRGFPRGYELAMRGIDNLIRYHGADEIMVTTVVNHENISQLPELFEIFDKVDIDTWRLTGIEPIGRAMDHPEMLLTPEDNRQLMKFIKEKRDEKLPVTYSCCHFLGLEYEAEVRNWYFLCNAGIYVAGIMENGDVGACLDIPRNEKTIQGNVYKERFTDIWRNRFEIYRTSLAERNSDCAACDMAKWCRGGSYHSWDYDEEKPKVCMKGTLFE